MDFIDYYPASIIDNFTLYTNIIDEGTEIYLMKTNPRYKFETDDLIKKNYS